MIGEKIKKMRESANLTQDQFSKAIGINANTLASYERNIREPKIDTILMFANYFRVSTDYLLGITDYPTPYDQSQFKDALLNNKKKGQIEAIEKRLISCCIKHYSDQKFFPLWFDWLIKYFLDNIEVFDELIDLTNTEAPAAELGEKVAECMRLGSSFSMAISENYLNASIKRAFQKE